MKWSSDEEQHSFPITSSSVVSPSASPTQVYETPFFVAVDHEKKKVVISIRGTLSLKVKLLLELFVLTLKLWGFFLSLVLSPY